MRKHDQISRTRFLEKCGGLSLYYIGIERRYRIYGEDILFVKKCGYASIGNPDNTYGISTDHEYFSFLMTSLI